MCATSPTERIFQPKIVLVIRGQGIPQNSHHEIDIMQEIYWGGGHTHKMAASVWDGDRGRSGCDGGLCRAMEQARRERQHGGKVSPWPLVMVELLALNSLCSVGSSWQEIPLSLP